LGPSGICALFVVSILLGRLIPGAQVDRMLKVRDERIAELAAALKASEEREGVLSQQNLELMETGRTALQLMRALPQAPAPVQRASP
jgi:hypothetical protein